MSDKWDKLNKEFHEALSKFSKEDLKKWIEEDKLLTMTHHTEVLNYIIETKGYKRYCEIGTQGGRNFNEIKAPFKTGVDPDINSVATHHMTSDKFFEGNSQLFDIYFIDGMHTAEQVEKDFVNAMAYLAEGGLIVLHDTNPEREQYTVVPRQTKVWNGNVYQFICKLGRDFITLSFDHGITIAKKNCSVFEGVPITWTDFDLNRNELLRIVTLEEFKTWINE